MPRPKALRRILPAVASLGVDELVLLNAVNVDKSYWGSPLVKPDSIRRLLDLGLEQAVDTRSPRIVVERRFRPFVEDELPDLTQGAEKRWLLHPPAKRLAPRASRSGMTWLAIGPETGWTPFELELLTSRGFVAASLGPRMLRVETVVPYALGILISL
jgi:RsmE family RNA methyltransferase